MTELFGVHCSKANIFKVSATCQPKRQAAHSWLISFAGVSSRIRPGHVCQGLVWNGTMRPWCYGQERALMLEWPIWLDLCWKHGWQAKERGGRNAGDGKCLQCAVWTNLAICFEFIDLHVLVPSIKMFLLRTAFFCCPLGLEWLSLLHKNVISC